MLEQKRKAAEEEKLRMDPDCTFKPQLMTEYQFHDPRANIYERSQMYNRNEKDKEELERKKQEQLQRDLEECTFKPKINQPKIPPRKKADPVKKIKRQGKRIR